MNTTSSFLDFDNSLDMTADTDLSFNDRETDSGLFSNSDSIFKSPRAPVSPSNKKKRKAAEAWTPSTPSQNVSFSSTAPTPKLRNRRTIDDDTVGGTNPSAALTPAPKMKESKTNELMKVNDGNGEFLENMKAEMEGIFQEITSSAGTLGSLHKKGDTLKVKTDGIQREISAYHDKLVDRKGKLYEGICQVTNILSPNKRTKQDGDQ